MKVLVHGHQCKLKWKSCLRHVYNMKRNYNLQENVIWATCDRQTKLFQIVDKYIKLLNLLTLIVHKASSLCIVYSNS